MIYNIKVLFCSKFDKLVLVKEQ